MTNHKSTNFILILFMMVALVSCQSTQPTSQPPEPTVTTEAIPSTEQTPTAYPTPEATTLPTSTKLSLVLPEVVSQVTATQEITPALVTTSTATVPVNPYPGPQNQTTVQPGDTAGPYPGPQQTPGLPAQTLQPGAPTATLAQGLLTPGTGTPVSATLTPTLIPTPGLVQTELRATNPEDFTLASGTMQLVEFFAFWSPTSKSMAPVMYNLEHKYEGQIQFSFLDIDDPANGLYKMLLGDRLPPVFFLLDGQGNVMAEFQGYVKPEEFEAAFVLPPLQPTTAPPPTP